MEISKEIKREIGEIAAINFETDNIKKYFIDMCELIPSYFFSMPSSTSGKYHNAKQCEKYGQLYHAFMFASILEHRLRLKWNKELFSTSEIRDCMRCVPIFHDAVKKGWNGSQYTVANHPVLAAEWVKESKVENDIPDEMKMMIADMCEAHSGEWNKSKSGKTIMSEPRNQMEFLIHECDILSSRNDIDWIISEELKTIIKKMENEYKESFPSINEYVLNFGKHTGKTLPEVFNIDPGWIRWAKENLTREPVKTLLKEL